MVFILSDWSYTLHLSIQSSLSFCSCALRVLFLAPCFSPCISSLCLPLLTHTLSCTIHLLTTYNDKCLLPLIEYLSYFILCCNVCVMSMLGQLRTCLSLLTTRQISCLSPIKGTSHLHNLPTSITIGNAQIPVKMSVKNLGITLDCHLTMNAHVTNIVRTCYFELHRLTSIRRSWQVLQLPHLYLHSFCQELTTVAHCCLVLLIMWHPACNENRTMQLG